MKTNDSWLTAKITGFVEPHQSGISQPRWTRGAAVACLEGHQEQAQGHRSRFFPKESHAGGWQRSHTHPRLFKSFSCFQAPNQWSFPSLLFYSPPTTVAYRTNLVRLGFYLFIHRVIWVTTPFFLTAEQVLPWTSKGQGQTGNTRGKKKPRKCVQVPGAAGPGHFRLHRIPELLLQW